MHRCATAQPLATSGRTIMTEAAYDMKAGDPVRVVPYDPAWPHLFARLGGDLRAALGSVAVRIDHIGSTAVPGLVAKPVIDIQISVAAFEPLACVPAPAGALGLCLPRRQHGTHQALLPRSARCAPDPYPRPAGRQLQ